jgi:hypothetical protein
MYSTLVNANTGTWFYLFLLCTFLQWSTPIGVKLGESGGSTVNGAEGKLLVDTILLLL